jgi:2-hydroxychromene-2-carboxylate isomerase
MPSSIAFYFDFISPYAYLGSLGVEKIAAKHGREVDWRPTLLGVSVLRVMGLKPIPDTPLKGPYMLRDVPRFARLLGIPYSERAPIKMAPLPAARAFTWAKERDPQAAKRLGQAILHAHWGEGRDMSSPEAVAGLAESVGFRIGDVRAAIEDEMVKARLRQHVDAALAAGVFGTPTFVVDGEMFWGADRLDQVERWLVTGGW